MASSDNLKHLSPIKSSNLVHKRRQFKTKQRQSFRYFPNKCTVSSSVIIRFFQVKRFCSKLSTALNARHCPKNKKTTSLNSQQMRGVSSYSTDFNKWQGNVLIIVIEDSCIYHCCISSTLEERLGYSSSSLSQYGTTLLLFTDLSDDLLKDLSTQTYSFLSVRQQGGGQRETTTQIVSAMVTSPRAVNTPTTMSFQATRPLNSSESMRGSQYPSTSRASPWQATHWQSFGPWQSRQLQWQGKQLEAVSWSLALRQ